MSLSRRHLMATLAAAGSVGTALGQAPSESFPFDFAAPDLLDMETDAGWVNAGQRVHLTPVAGGLKVTIVDAPAALNRLHLRWLVPAQPGTRYLGDDWERSYGTLAWRGLEPDRILPWYFLSCHGQTTAAYGVRTQPAAFCAWQVDAEGISLWLDVRSGAQPVRLGKRTLDAAVILAARYTDRSPFAAAGDFCHRLCPAPRLSATSVYGGNNWYYAYGKSSADDIRRDSARMASLAPTQGTRPYMVIDDGWTPNATAGPWNVANPGFGDMAKLATDMRHLGVQPGIWLRPLFTTEAVPESWRLTNRKPFTLDPSVPDVLQRCSQDIRRVAGWGYTLIKHDFSTYDLLGRWGFAMGAELTASTTRFNDQTRTTAEILLDFYRALRAAAGNNLLLGCNTVGHLTAGLFELQRTGDDTSGRDWNRTRKMGVNTLAFRLPQHNTFFAVDADCVGITRNIDWTLNRQWLELLAGSGTALFVSAAPDALTAEQAAAVRRAFAQAAQTQQAAAEPLDWLETTSPEHWNIHGKPATFRWFGATGASATTG